MNGWTGRKEGRKEGRMGNDYNDTYGANQSRLIGNEVQLVNVPTGTMDGYLP